VVGSLQHGRRPSQFGEILEILGRLAAEDHRDRCRNAADGGLCVARIREAFGAKLDDSHLMD
jgi:hypothetical protein